MSGLLLGVLLASAPAPAAEAQRVVVHAAFVDLVPETVVATIEQSGATQRVELRDDADDAPGDRVWTGSVTGDPAQYLQVVLAVTADGLTRDVYSGALRVGNAPTVEVALEVTTREGGELVGARRTSASPGRVTHAIEAVPILAATFWAVFVLVLGAVALQSRAAERAGTASGTASGTGRTTERQPDEASGQERGPSVARGAGP